MDQKNPFAGNNVSRRRFLQLTPLTIAIATIGPDLLTPSALSAQEMLTPEQILYAANRDLTESLIPTLTKIFGEGNLNETYAGANSYNQRMLQGSILDVNNQEVTFEITQVVTGDKYYYTMHIPGDMVPYSFNTSEEVIARILTRKYAQVMNDRSMAYLPVGELTSLFQKSLVLTSFEGDYVLSLDGKSIVWFEGNGLLTASEFMLPAEAFEQICKYLFARQKGDSIKSYNIEITINEVLSVANVSGNIQDLLLSNVTVIDLDEVPSYITFEANGNVLFENNTRVVLVAAMSGGERTGGVLVMNEEGRIIINPSISDNQRGVFNSLSLHISSAASSRDRGLTVSGMAR